MKNGVLLRATHEAGIQILVTVDRRMEYQQNIPKSGLALLVLQARSTRLPTCSPSCRPCASPSLRRGLGKSLTLPYNVR